MRKSITLTLCALAVACARNETPSRRTTTTRVRPSDVRNAKVNEVIQPAPQFINSSLLGADLGTNGTVSKETLSFEQGQPIYLTLVLRESPPGLQTSAVWMDSRKKELRIERKQMNGAKVATFGFRDPKLKPGRYRVIGYWGGNIAAERDFEIVAAKAKRKKG
jgi:hypothetical protein